MFLEVVSGGGVFKHTRRIQGPSLLQLSLTLSSRQNSITPSFVFPKHFIHRTLVQHCITLYCNNLCVFSQTVSFWRAGLILLLSILYSALHVTSGVGSPLLIFVELPLGNSLAHFFKKNYVTRHFLIVLKNLLFDDYSDNCAVILQIRHTVSLQSGYLCLLQLNYFVSLEKPLSIKPRCTPQSNLFKVCLLI